MKTSIMKTIIRLFAVMLLLALPARVSAQLSTSSVNPQDDSLAVRQMRIYLNGIRRSEDRPTVALVLSGGGAKGAAHVGVLKYLEENGIPVDVVIGTSMGGLMGGLYSLGYSATELDSLLRAMDWARILSDDVPKDYISYKTKKYREIYTLRVPFHYLKRDLQRRMDMGMDMSVNKMLKTTPDKERKMGISQETVEEVIEANKNPRNFITSLPAGFVAGLNVTNQISSLSVGYQDNHYFTDLPRPFFCVASDLVSRKAYNWSRGSIVEALRSTMSIPGLFDPVRYEGKILIDGGTRNNFPTDIARAMGADIVIGVELSEPERTYTDINNLGNLLMPLIEMMGSEAFQKNIENVDLFIKPDLAGYNMLSFDAASIDDIISRGYKAAQSQQEGIARIKEQVAGASLGLHNTKAIDIGEQYVQINTIAFTGITDPESLFLSKKLDIRAGDFVSKEEIEDAMAIIYATGAFNMVTYRLYGEKAPYRLIFDCEKGPVHQMGLGFRADSEELVSLIFNIGFGALNLKGPSIEFTGRVGQDKYLDAHFDLDVPGLPTLNARARLEGNVADIIYADDFRYRIGFWGHKEEVYFSDISWKKASINLGARNRYYQVGTWLSNDGTQMDHDTMKNFSGNFNSAFGDLRLDTTDDGNFPTKGTNIGARYEFVFYKSNTPDFEPFHIASLDFHHVIPVRGDFVFIPGLHARAVIDNSPYDIYHDNYIGGYMSGRFVDHRIPFPGLSNAAMVGDYAIVVDAELRTQLTRNVYFGAKFAAIKDGNTIPELYESLRPSNLGAALEVSYKTVLGPLKGVVHWSDLTHRTGFYMSFGYDF